MSRAAVILVLLITLLPTGAGLLAALAGATDAHAYLRLLAAPGVGRAIGLSLFTGVASTLLALVLAHALVALAVTGRWRRRLTAWSLPLLALPHLALGIGLALVLAPSGLLLRLLSPWATGLELPPDWHTVRDPAGLGLILGLVIKETCFLVMALSAALAQVPAQAWLTQTRALGYGRLKGFAVAVAPALQRQIALPTAAVLAYGIGNVDLALALGPDLPPTFAVLLWRWLLDPAPQAQALAHAGAIVLLLMTVCALAGLMVAQRASARLWLRVATSGRRARRERGLRAFVAVTAATGFALGVAAIAALALRAFSGPWRFPRVSSDTALATAWHDAWPALAPTLPTTAALAGLTAAVSITLCLAAAEALHAKSTQRRRLGQWLFVPLLLPQMTFLFGIQVLLIGAHADGTVLAVAWLHVVFALPYVWGILAPARAALDPRLGDVAASLGASPLSAWWRVTRPLLTRAALLAAALAISVSLALYLPTLFAGAGRVNTAATEAAAAVAAGNLRLAAVHAILLGTGPLLAFALAYALGAVAFRKRRDVP